MLVIAALIIWWRGEESLDHAGKAAVNCLTHMDSGCLYHYVSEDERKELGLTSESFGRFCNDCVFPLFQGATSIGPTQADYTDATGVGEFYFSFADRAGVLHRHGLELAKTDEGPRFIHGMLALAMIALRSTDDAGRQLRGLEKLKAWRDSTTEQLPRFLSSGTLGVTMDVPDRGSTVLPWRDFADYWTKKVNDAETLRRSSPAR